jgi:hypothetical protein
MTNPPVNTASTLDIPIFLVIEEKGTRNETKKTISITTKPKITTTIVIRRPATLTPLSLIARTFNIMILNTSLWK